MSSSKLDVKPTARPGKRLQGFSREEVSADEKLKDEHNLAINLDSLAHHKALLKAIDTAKEISNDNIKIGTNTLSEKINKIIQEYANEYNKNNR